MDDLDRIERERVSLFSLAAVLSGLLYLLATSRVTSAVLVGICAGLLVSGAFVARKMTQPHNWAMLEPEARIAGSTLSRKRVWFGNLAPFVAALACAGWLMHSL